MAWRAGNVLAWRRAATGGAARGLTACTGTLMAMEGAAVRDMVGWGRAC